MPSHTLRFAIYIYTRSYCNENWFYAQCGHDFVRSRMSFNIESVTPPLINTLYTHTWYMITLVLVYLLVVRLKRSFMRWEELSIDGNPRQTLSVQTFALTTAAKWPHRY